MLGIDRALRRSAALAAPLILAVAMAAPATAQTDVEMIGRMMGGTRPPASYFRELAVNPRAFEFSGEGGWVRRAQRVAAARQAARGRSPVRGQGPLLMASQALPTLDGDFNVPVLLVAYSNTDSAAIAALLPRDTMQFRLFGTHDPTVCAPITWKPPQESEWRAVSGVHRAR